MRRTVRIFRMLVARVRGLLTVAATSLIIASLLAAYPEAPPIITCASIAGTSLLLAGVKTLRG